MQMGKSGGFEAPKVTIAGAALRRLRKESIRSRLDRASEWPKKSLRPGGGGGGRRSRAEMIKDWTELPPSPPKGLGLIPNVKSGTWGKSLLSRGMSLGPQRQHDMECAFKIGLEVGSRVHTIDGCR